MMGTFINWGLVVLARPFFFITTGSSFPWGDIFVNKQKFFGGVDRTQTLACKASGALVAP
jgi:hypothetical protein